MSLFGFFFSLLSFGWLEIRFDDFIDSPRHVLFRDGLMGYDDNARDYLSQLEFE